MSRATAARLACRVCHCRQVCGQPQALRHARPSTSSQARLYSASSAPHVRRSNVVMGEMEAPSYSSTPISTPVRSPTNYSETYKHTDEAAAIRDFLEQRESARVSTPAGKLSSSSAAKDRRSGAEGFRVALCPDVPRSPVPSFPCTFCPKAFAFEDALARHLKTHETHPHECAVCMTRFQSKDGLRYHTEAKHAATRPEYVCDVCDNAYLSARGLALHKRRESSDHASKRSSLDFQSAQEFNECFRCPSPVPGHVMYHTTTRVTADKVFSDGHLKGRAAFNVHDGALRSRGAPEVVFCSIEDEHPVVSPFPGHAEPGEVCTSIMLSLDRLVRTAGEYRLFVAGSVPFRGDVFDEAHIRTTLLFSRDPAEWAWCESKGMVELDVADNSALCYSRREGAWRFATQFLSPERGWRTVKIVVALGGRSVPVSEFEPPLQFRSIDVAHMFMNKDRPQCPGCLKHFRHRMEIFSHLDVFELPLRTGEDFASLLVTNSESVDAQMSEALPYRYACSSAECDRTFANKVLLASHERSHESSRLYSCRFAECGERFVLQKDRIAHEDVHLDGHPFLCLHCPKAFKTRGQRTAHEASHSDERPFVCSHSPCEATAKTAIAMRHHERSVHENRKREHFCSHEGCTSRGFVTLKGLRHHETTVHTSGRSSSGRSDFKYACAQCDARLSSYRSLRIHERRHHV